MAYHFPDQVVLGTFAAAPTAGTPGAQLAAIAGAVEELADADHVYKTDAV